MKYTRGTKVKVVYEGLSFTGLTGTIEFGDTDEDGDVQYILKDITYPTMINKQGVEYTITKVLFYEVWLKAI